MKKHRSVYIATILSALIFTVLSISVLPDKLSLSLDTQIKSKWYLVLLSLTPLISTFLLENSKGGEIFIWKIFIPVECYALLIVIDALLYDLDLAHLLLVLMIMLFFFLFLEIRKKESKVKIQLKWIEKDSKAYWKAQWKAQIVFFIAFLSSLLFFILSLSGLVPISYAFASGSLVVFLGSFLIIRTGL
ncbi:MAG: hypothetical protein IJ836_01535 [Spirochaetales bacterium]|nr:hypothetical protein [Spirochaetales bacterium]